MNGIAIRGAVSQFTSETVTTIQCRTIRALGLRRTPESLRLLVQIAATPAERPKTTGVEAASASITLEAAARQASRTAPRCDLQPFGRWVTTTTIRKDGLVEVLDQQGRRPSPAGHEGLVRSGRTCRPRVRPGPIGSSGRANSLGRSSCRCIGLARTPPAETVPPRWQLAGRDSDSQIHESTTVFRLKAWDHIVQDHQT